MTSRELRALIVDRRLQPPRRKSGCATDRSTLISMLRAYDVGLLAAEGADTDACEQRGLMNRQRSVLSDAELPCDSAGVVSNILDSPGPKGLDIGGTLAKVAIALPADVAHCHGFPDVFGLTGRTRGDLEFPFEHNGHKYVLRFVSGATSMLEGAVKSVKDAEAFAGCTPLSDASTADSILELDAINPLMQPGSEWPRTDRIFTSGGGAHKFAAIFQNHLDVKLLPVKEMASVVDGLLFLSTYGPRSGTLFTVDENDEEALLPWPETRFPFLVVNMGSGVSILRVDSARENDYVRVGGTACGGGTFLGLARALTSAETFAQALRLAEDGDASKCDLLVGDIYGEDGSASLGLPSRFTASNFGRLGAVTNEDLKTDVSSAGTGEKGGNQIDSTALCSEQDLARALLQMVTQQSVLLSSAFAQNSGCVDRVFFVGGFVEEGNHVARSRISASFRSLGGRAYFLHHCDYLGALGSLQSCLRHGANAFSTPCCDVDV